MVVVKMPNNSKPGFGYALPRGVDPERLVYFAGGEGPAYVEGLGFLLIKEGDENPFYPDFSDAQIDKR